jgi:hypothetical protein
MLEQPGLLLCPWQMNRAFGHNGATTAGHRLPCRPILDLQSRQQLGLVRKTPAAGWPILRWLGRQVWQVLETEDESLLLTLHCPWGLVRPWEARDADDHLVCTLNGGEIFDATGCRRVRSCHNGSGQVYFRCKEGIELASCTAGPEGLDLRFAPVIDMDPYAKMALLAAALTIRTEATVPVKSSAQRRAWPA